MRNTILRMTLPFAVLAGLAACGDSPETLLAKARDAYAAENYDLARIQVATALRDDPGNREMLALLVRSHLRLGDPDGADGAIGRLEAAGGSGAEVTLMKAEAALLRGKPELALTLAGKADGIDAWRVRAQSYLALEQEQKALEAFDKGMAAGGDVQLVEAYARYCLVAGDLDCAGRVYARMRELAPGSYEALVMAGDLASARGRTGEAIAAFRKTIEKFPDRVPPRLALATQYDMQGKVKEAMAAVEEAEGLSSGDPAVEALKIQLLSELGQWEKIRDALQGRESQLEPGSSLSMSYGEALLRLGHAEQARLLFKRATLVLPGNPYSRLMLGEAQLATGDAQSAWRTLQPLAESTLARPEVIDAARRAATVARAPEAAELKARLEPDALKATMALVDKGQGAILRQDWAGALPVYEELLRRGEDAEVLKRLALASSHLGRGADAIAYADRAVAASPTNPDYLYLAGMVRLSAGDDLPKALRLLQSAADADPRNETIARELRKAKAAAG